MFSLFARGRAAPQHDISTNVEGPIRVDEARLAAWALALGEVRPRADPPAPARKPHRGMLPDVDWSNAVPVPRRSLLKLLAATLAARMTPLASLGDTGSPMPSGQNLPAAGGAPIPMRRLAVAQTHLQNRAA